MRASGKTFLFWVISFCLTASIAFAQEAQNPPAETDEMATEAEMYFASGTVVEATAAQLVISEYDFDAGQETKVAYQVNAQTQFEGVNGVAEIKTGDDVEIEYQLAGEQKLATRVEKYAPEEGDEEMEPAAEASEEMTEKINE